MGEHVSGPRFRLLRVEGSAAEARAVTISVHETFDAALAAAARLPNQPRVPWKVDDVDGVWTRIDRNGFGFVLHRLDAQDFSP